jgi:16S rRNA (adenine1518-N6/adenine1519-N6)-dimethyltransferase
LGDADRPLPPLREVIARHGLRARRSLGQHYLLDLNLTARIARAAGDLSQGTTIEVGPGPGGLTRALLAAGAGQVIAIEKDRRCRPALDDLASHFPGRLTVIEGDAQALDVTALGEAPRHLVANLPYNVSTVLLLAWLGRIAEDPGCLTDLTLMFQKEVAQRLAGQPGSKDYGRLTVVTQWLSEVRLLFDVPARAFTPAPKVTSTVVALTPRPAPLHPAVMSQLERVTAAAFGQRRKMLRQSLKSLGVPVPALIAAAGVIETARAEALTLAEFCALARAFGALSR